MSDPDSFGGRSGAERFAIVDSVGLELTLYALDIARAQCTDLRGQTDQTMFVAALSQHMVRLVLMILRDAVPRDQRRDVAETLLGQLSAACDAGVHTD